MKFSFLTRSVRVYFLLIFTLIGILFGVILLAMSDKILMRISKEYLVLIADSISNNIVTSNYNDFLVYDYYNLRLKLDKLFEHESVEFLYFVDPSKQVVYGRTRQIKNDPFAMILGKVHTDADKKTGIVTVVKPISTDNGHLFGHIVIGLNNKVLAGILNHYRPLSILLIIFTYTCALVLIWICLRAVTKSLDVLKNTIESTNSLNKFRQNEKNGRLVFTEFEQLRLTYHNMLLRLSDYRLKIEEKSRMAAIGDVTAQVVHDLRGPLSSIKVALNYFRTHKGCSPQCDEHIQLLELGTNRLSGVADGLLNKSKSDNFQETSFDLRSVVDDLVREYRLQCKSVQIVSQYPDDLFELYGPGIYLQRALSNIIKNAIEAIEGKGVVTITVNGYYSTNSKTLGQCECSPYDRVLITISDNGPGMSDGTLQKVLHGGYSTGKPDGNGIGMKVVRDVIAEFGGTVTAQSEVGKGTSFMVSLPILKATKTCGSFSLNTIAQPKILLIDDDYDIRLSWKLLHGSVNELVSFASMEECEIARPNFADFDVAFVDKQINGSAWSLEQTLIFLRTAGVKKLVISSGETPGRWQGTIPPHLVDGFTSPLKVPTEIQCYL